MDSNRITDNSKYHQYKLMEQHELNTANITTLRFYIEALDDSNTQFGKNNFNNSILLEAIARKDIDFIYRILKHPNINEIINLPDQVAVVHNTPLMFAIKSGLWDVADKILDKLEAKAASLDMPDAYGVTPLHYACLFRKDDPIQKMLAKDANKDILFDPNFDPHHHKANAAKPSISPADLYAFDFQKHHNIDISTSHETGNMFFHNTIEVRVVEYDTQGNYFANENARQIAEQSVLTDMNNRTNADIDLLTKLVSAEAITNHAIPSDSMLKLGEKLHDRYFKNDIRQYCRISEDITQADWDESKLPANFKGRLTTDGEMGPNKTVDKARDTLIAKLKNDQEYTKFHTREYYDTQYSNIYQKHSSLSRIKYL
jgi:ankyrin repeat protein